MICGTFCWLVNIANRFLRIFFELVIQIKSIFPGVHDSDSTIGRDTTFNFHGQRYFHGMWSEAKRSEELSWAELSWAELSWAELSWAELSWAELSWAELSWAELSWAELSWAELSWAELNWTELNWTELNWTELNWTELKRSEAKRSEAKRSEAKRSEAKRSEAKRSEAKWTELNRRVLHSYDDLNRSALRPERSLSYKPSSTRGWRSSHYTGAPWRQYTHSATTMTTANWPANKVNTLKPSLFRCVECGNYLFRTRTRNTTTITFQNGCRGVTSFDRGSKFTIFMTNF